MTPAPANRLTMLVLLAAAAACVGAAVGVPTATWAEWFHHPGRTATPEHAAQGAGLWRIMLSILALALAGAAMLIPQASRWADEARPAPTKTATEAAQGGAISRETWIVLGLLVLATVLRGLRLNESLWYDEIAMWLSYGAAGPGAIVGDYADPVNHIAHTLVTWLAVRFNALPMDMELLLRLPAVVASLLAAVFVFALGREVVSVRVGAIAGALMAALPVAVLSGIEARGYSMVICLTAASTWALMRARRTNDATPWAVYALLAALTVWTHMVAAAVFLGHDTWLKWASWRDRAWRAGAVGFGALALAAVLTLTLYAPVLPEVMGQVGDEFQRTEADQPALWGGEGVRMVWQAGGSWTWWAALPGLAMVGGGLIWLWRDRAAPGARRRRELVALLWLGLPVAMLAVVLAGTWVYARFVLFVVPASAVTMALGVEWLWQWRREAAVGALVGLLSLATIDVQRRPTKQPVREAATYVRQHRAAYEPVLAVTIGHAVMRMYASDMPLRHSFMHGRDLPAQLERDEPSWVIVLYPDHLDADAADALEHGGYEAVQRFAGWVDDGDVVVYRRW